MHTFLLSIDGMPYLTVERKEQACAVGYFLNVLFGTGIDVDRCKVTEVLS